MSELGLADDGQAVETDPAPGVMVAEDVASAAAELVAALRTAFVMAGLKRDLLMSLPLFLYPNGYHLSYTNPVTFPTDQ
jgi:hypothetical protein